MGEIRRGAAGEAVVVVPGRTKRSNDFSTGPSERQAQCPFCPGHEAETPPEVFALRSDGSAADARGWSVRVVPNRYAALARDDGEAYGAHEVIIETPDHAKSLGDLDRDEAANVVRAWMDRLRSASADDGLAYALIFKNHGERAGASREHTHSQLLALPFLPKKPAEELAAFQSGEFGRELARDQNNPTLLVRRGERVAAFAPRAGRFPSETWIAPRVPAPRFEEIDEETVGELAELLPALLRALPRAHGEPAYHVLVHTAPFRAEGAERYCWRIELCARINRVAGGELASGVFLNQIPPEDGARLLREALDED